MFPAENNDKVIPGIKLFKSRNTDQVFYDTFDNFTGVSATDKDDCTWILDFLRFTGFKCPFGSRILGLSDCGRPSAFSTTPKRNLYKHDTKHIWDPAGVKLASVAEWQSRKRARRLTA